MDKTWWDLSALNWHYESQVRRESEGTTVHPVHLLNKRNSIWIYCEQFSLAHIFTTIQFRFNHSRLLPPSCRWDTPEILSAKDRVEGGVAQNHTLLRANRLKNHAFINSHTFQYAPTNVHLGTIWNDRFSVRAGVWAVDKAPIFNSIFFAQQSKRDEVLSFSISSFKNLLRYLMRIWIFALFDLSLS